MLGVRRAVDEIPLLQVPLLALDQREALTEEDEEIFLVRLPVVAAARLTRLEDGDRVAELGERDLVALDDAGIAQDIVRDPRRVSHVDDEPAVGDRGEPVLRLLEPRRGYWFHLSAVFLPCPLAFVRGSAGMSCGGRISACERRADQLLRKRCILREKRFTGS